VVGKPTLEGASGAVWKFEGVLAEQIMRDMRTWRARTHAKCCQALQRLDMYTLKNLKALPSSFGNLPLRILRIRDVPLRELPASFGCLAALEEMYFVNYDVAPLVDLPLSFVNLLRSGAYS